MKAVLISYRRGRNTQKSNHGLIRVEGVDTKEKAEKLVGKKVQWKSKKAVIKGEIKAAHGVKGVVRAIFEKGLPGQAMATEIELL
jgi:large subunit ribosomal protein L35Ae